MAGNLWWKPDIGAIPMTFRQAAFCPLMRHFMETENQSQRVSQQLRARPMRSDRTAKEVEVIYGKFTSIREICGTISYARQAILGCGDTAHVRIEVFLGPSNSRGTSSRSKTKSINNLLAGAMWNSRGGT